MLSAPHSAAQTRQRTYEGVVLDGKTGEVLPFANVYIKGTLIGVTSDFDGAWKISIPVNTDSLSFNVMGYNNLSIPLSKLKFVGNIIEMYEQTLTLNEVTVSPDDARRYLQYADKVTTSLFEHYRAEPGSHHGFLLLHSVGHHPADSEVDVPLNYADYYYLEAMQRRRELRMPTK